MCKVSMCKVSKVSMCKVSMCKVSIGQGHTVGPTTWSKKKIGKNYNFGLTRQIWGIWKLRPAYSPETPNLGQNRWCFVPCDLEIWWMTLENNRASLLCCFKLCATFHSHRWIQTGVTVRKRAIWVKFDDFLELCDLEIWQMTLKNNRAPLQCYFKLCASFRSHWWFQTGVTVRKRLNWVKIDDF